MRLVTAILLLWFSVPVLADSTWKVHTTIKREGQAASSHTDVFYRHVDMLREENLGIGTTPILITIDNCASKDGYLIDTKAREYRSYKLPSIWSAAQYQDLLRRNPNSVVTLQSQTVDTGERKTFFGHTARHLVTTMKRAATPETGNAEQVTDGWYVSDLAPQAKCAPVDWDSNSYYVLSNVLVEFPQMFSPQHSGPLPVGFAMTETITVRLPAPDRKSATRTVTLERIVESFSDAVVKPELFALPSGLRQNPNLLKGSSAH